MVFFHSSIMIAVVVAILAYRFADDVVRQGSANATPGISTGSVYGTIVLTVVLHCFIQLILCITARVDLTGYLMMVLPVISFVAGLCVKGVLYRRIKISS
ncbi:MAG: hypothetical protein R3B38_01035 [Patescibacteria group bacterium]